MRRVAMHIAAGECKAGADGELVRGARRTAQNDFGGENVTGKPGQGRDFYAHKFADGAAEAEMMGRDMERYVFHDLVEVEVVLDRKVLQPFASEKLRPTLRATKTTNRLD